jgi:hypothetical protein
MFRAAGPRGGGARDGMMSTGTRMGREKNLTCRVYFEVFCAVVGAMYTFLPKEFLQGDEVRLFDFVLENFQPDRSALSARDLRYTDLARAPTSSCPWFRILISRAFFGLR